MLLSSWKKGSFYIEDNNSKFGTLVYVRKPVPLSGDYSNLSVQIGRSVLGFTVKRNWKMLPACFSSAKGQVDTNHDIEENNVDSGDEILFEPGVGGNNNNNDQPVGEIEINAGGEEDGAIADDLDAENNDIDDEIPQDIVNPGAIVNNNINNNGNNNNNHNGNAAENANNNEVAS